MKKIKLEKQHYIIGAVVLALILILVGTLLFKAGSKDGAKFKSEYEKLNGEKASNDKSYQTLKIDKNNKVKYISLDEAVGILTDGTGIIYFGMPDCPWCRGIVPVLLDKMNCSCLENLYYVDMKDERNTYEVKDDKPVETKKASSAYYQILELLDDYLENYSIKDDEGVEHVVPEKRAYVPLVVAVKKGKVISAHTGSVELGDTQSPFDDLTDIQKSELEVIFDKMISEVSADEETTTCDNHC